MCVMGKLGAANGYKGGILICWLALELVNLAMLQYMTLFDNFGIKASVSGQND